MAHQPRLPAAAALLLAAAAATAGCSSTHPAGTGTGNQPETTATAYMRAWLVKPSDPDTMCRLQLPAMRPNYPKDGGTQAGCVAAYRADFAGQGTDAGRPALTLTVTDQQDLPASAGQPAGTGVLVTGHRPGTDPFRYALRLVGTAGTWRIAQVADADGDQYAHNPDPVADVLEAQ
jgi:hypothetical protein